MANKTVKTRVQNKHDVEANWSTSFVPLAGELIIYDPDGTYSYPRFKIGDGTKSLGSLPFLHTLRTGGDITVNSSTGVVTVNNDSHTHDSRYYTESEINAKLESINADIAAVDANKAPKSHGIHYIEGTGSTAGTWLGTHEDITEYYAGLVLAYKIGVAGSSSGTTLNINNLGAVTVVKNATSAISTNFAVGSVLFLVYTVDSNGTAYWKAHDYDANTRNSVGDYRKNSTKLYFVGTTSSDSATSTSYATSYTNSNCYVGTDNSLYSNNEKVLTTSDMEDLEADLAAHTHTITASASDDDVVVLTGTNGTNAVTYSASHANSGVTAGTYKSVTVNAKGHVTAGSNPTTLSGYGITNAYTKTEVDNKVSTINAAIAAKSDSGHSHTITAGASDDDVVVLTGTNGTNGVSYSASHANSGATAGTYRSVTVNAKGHVTAGSNPTTISGYGITDAYTKTNVDDKVSTINAAIAAKSDSGHTHDDRYFTETEVNTKLSDKVSKSDTSVQCMAGGMVVGKTSATGISGTGQGRIMFTGQTNPLIGVQAIAADGTAKTPYYLQAIANNDSFCIGPTSSKALTFDTNGNMTSPANLTIQGTITEGTQTLANKYAPKSHTHSYIATSQKGAASGVAELDSSGKVPTSQLPSFVDDVIEGTYVNSTSFKNTSGTALTGETGKIYVDTSTNKTYRWSGSAFTEISASLALGETSSTAYRGDRGKTAYDHSQSAHLSLGETSSTAYRGDRGKTAYDHSQATHARTDATATAASTTNGSIKINGTDTTVYTLPTASSTLGGVKTTSTVTSTSGLTACPIISGVPYYKNTTYSNASLGQGYGTCSTAAATAAKVVTLSSYSLTTGGMVSVKFTYAVPANATLNINSKGAKSIYYQGKALVDGVICAGEVATFIYDGTYYHLLAVDRNRFYTSMVPYGTQITASETSTKDINSAEFLKVGNYFCSANAQAKYVSNLPESGTAFMMQVWSPLSQTVDNETGTWVYRIRKLTHYQGREYIQYCYTDGTGGNWKMGAWDKVMMGSMMSNYAPAYQYKTADLTAGSSTLATGTLYFVYE